MVCDIPIDSKLHAHGYFIRLGIYRLSLSHVLVEVGLHVCIHRAGGECPCMLWASTSVPCNLQDAYGGSIISRFGNSIFCKRLYGQSFWACVHRGKCACVLWMFTSILCKTLFGRASHHKSAPASRKFLCYSREPSLSLSPIKELGDVEFWLLQRS